MKAWRQGRTGLRPRGADRTLRYRGDPAESFWCFDEEMARATETYHAKSDSRQAQQVDFVQVTVVAWQSGRGTDPKVRAAPPVERNFWLIP